MPSLDMRPGALDLTLRPGNRYTLRFDWPAEDPLDGRTFAADLDGVALDVSEPDGQTFTITFTSEVTGALVARTYDWTFSETTGADPQVLIADTLTASFTSQDAASDTSVTVILGDPAVTVAATLIAAGGGGGGGVTDHGDLTGLADDDHLQYHTDARGDARYWPLTTNLATQVELDAEATTRGAADTALDGRLDTLEAISIATDAELAAEAVLARNADNLTSGTVSDARIPSTIARDTEVQGLIDAAINALLDGAPGALDTLNELAAAVNDDASFAASVTASLATKQPLDADLTAIAALTTTSIGRSLLAAANDAALRTILGLGNVDNTSDANKPVSTATQTALNLKANAANPVFTGTVTIPDGALAIADTSGLQTALDAKALDSGVVHNTGNETVAGVKTFSSDPIIPDEAYGVGWNGSLEPPTKNAVYDKIEALGGGASFPPSGDLAMGGFKFTGLAAGSAAGESVRYEQMGRILSSVYADVVATAAAETTLFSYSIPGGLLAAGDALSFPVDISWLNNSGGTINFQWRLKLGATTIIDSGTLGAVNSTSRNRAKFLIDIAVASTTSQIADWAVVGSRGATPGVITATAASMAVGDLKGTSAENTATAKTLTLTVEPSAAGGTIDCTLHSAKLLLQKV